MTFGLAWKEGWESAGGRRTFQDEEGTEPGEGPGEKRPLGQRSLWGLQVLMEWINAELLPEHIVVRSLEEDMFDGLILHHLFRKRLSPTYPSRTPQMWGDSPHPPTPG